MAEMKMPNSDAVADVRDEDVERFEEAGWVKAASETKSTARKSSSSKSK